MSVTAVPLQPVKASYKRWLWFGLVLAVAAAFGLAWVGTRAVVAAKGTNEQFLSWNKTQPGIHTTASGLQYQVLKQGTGANAVDGDGVSLTIEGKKRDGEIFQPKGPLRYQIGAQPMIAGFTEAVKLMSKGSVYRVWLPANIAFGATPMAPPELKDAVLIFDISMDDLVTAAQIQQMQQMQQMQQQPPQGAEPGAPTPGGAPQGQP
ncbi:FKBP-type peptidyl-prolyl cis-trans isomerase [Sphingomonas sp.]|uniref:FKBP-type peptidyl-prolyl cis-trans isomerase n=1 Tax=Sphingomonas sp. TaxID=28214 RepID=UPI001B2BD023|nr:FKBP-type peptidyl-prolyl cis-trans isomerase [Sphingomonas sp.]MBO9712662.1 FKBP-type peptidyl-prolyl cis-trans isomerase [Sphingomonas sp.]